MSVRGTKRTFGELMAMSANDPKRTFDAAVVDAWPQR